MKIVNNGYTRRPKKEHSSDMFDYLYYWIHTFNEKSARCILSKESIDTELQDHTARCMVQIMSLLCFSELQCNIAIIAILIVYLRNCQLPINADCLTKNQCLQNLISLLRFYCTLLFINGIKPAISRKVIQIV